jgi:hypothetical protein
VQLSFRLSPFDNPNRCPILYAPARIQILQLGKHVRRSWRDQPLELEHGSFADEFGYVVSNTQA